MSRYCDHVACTKDLLDWFLWAVEQADPYSEVGEITNHVYGARGRILRHESNHTWEGVHRVLTDDYSDGLDFDAGDYPLRLCIHGGEWLLGGPRTVSLVEADEIPELVTRLRQIDRPWVLDKLLEMQRRTSPRFDRWDMHKYAERVSQEIDSLREFYAAVEKVRLPVVCTISH